MTVEVEQTTYSIHGTTEGPKVKELHQGEKTIIGGLLGEYYPDVVVLAKTEDSSELTLMFRPLRILGSIIKRADGSAENVAEITRKIRKTLDPHLDPEIKVTLNRGDELSYSTPMYPGYRAMVRQK